MKRSSNRFGGYRGRRTSTDILKTIAVVLAVLVVLMLAVLFWGQRYLIYTDDGPRLDLPFFQQEDREPLPDPGDVSYVDLSPGETGRDP